MKICEQKCPLPIVRKCCFCVPIRKGVIIFAYINMVLTLLSLPPMTFDLVEQATAGTSMWDQYMIELTLTVAFLIVDVVMLTLLIVGAHKVLVELIAYKLSQDGDVTERLFLCVLQDTCLAAILNFAFMNKFLNKSYYTLCGLSNGIEFDDVVNYPIMLVRMMMLQKKRVLLKIFFYVGMGFLMISVATDILYFDYRAYAANTIYFFLLCLDMYLMFLVYNLIRVVEEIYEVQYVAYAQGNQLAM